MSNKPPSNIRNRIHDYGDPYILDESPVDNTVCKQCGSVYTAGRWYPKDALPGQKASHCEPHPSICPACQKMHDRAPGGVLKISGGFIWEHRDDILNLIRNECAGALADNPLERVISMDTIDDEVHIFTTNEKLAQRIGRALHKAYSGHIEYKWSEDNKLARINWHRMA